MSRRRSANRRWSRQSLNNTGILVNNSNIFDEDDPLFYRNLMNQTNASRPSAAYSLADTTNLNPDSGAEPIEEESGEWWTGLNDTNPKLLPRNSASQATSQAPPANERESLGVILTESDNPTREIKKRRMRKVRRTRQSRGENLYAQALGDSEKVVESEPTFFIKPQVQDKKSISYNDNLPSSTSTESDQPRKKRPNILGYRTKNKRASINYEEIVGDDSIVGPSQEPANTQPRETTGSINKPEANARVISESEDDVTTPEKSSTTKQRFISKSLQNISNPYENIITDDDDDDDEINNSSDKKSKKLSIASVEGGRNITGGDLSSRSTPSISEKDYSFSRDNNSKMTASQDASSNSSISEELKVSYDSQEEAAINENVSSPSPGDDDEENVEKNKNNKDTESTERTKPPVFNKSTNQWETINDTEVQIGASKEWETIGDVDVDNEPLFEKSNKEKTPKKLSESLKNSFDNFPVSSRKTQSLKSIGQNLDNNDDDDDDDDDDDGRGNSLVSSTDENKENKSSETVESSRSGDKNSNKLSLNNSKNSRKADDVEVESTVTLRKSERDGRKKSLNVSNTSGRSRQKSLSEIRDESTVDESKNEETNIEDVEEAEPFVKTPRRSARLRNSSGKKTEDDELSKKQQHKRPRISGSSDNKSVEIDGNSESQKIDDNSSGDDDESSTDKIIDSSAYELSNKEQTPSFNVSEAETKKNKESNLENTGKKSISSETPSSSFKIHKKKSAKIVSDNSSDEEEEEEISKPFEESQENDDSQESEESTTEEETPPDVEDDTSKIVEKAKKSLENNKSKQDQSKYDEILSLDDDKNSPLKRREKSKEREEPATKPYKPGPRFTKSFLSQQPLSPVVLVIETQKDAETPELPRQKTPNEKRKRDEAEDQDAGQLVQDVPAPKKSLIPSRVSARKSLRSSSKVIEANTIVNQPKILNFFKSLNNQTKHPETEFDKKLIEAKKKLDIMIKKQETIEKSGNESGKKLEMMDKKNPLKTMLGAKKKLENKNKEMNTKKVIDKAYLIDGRPYKVPRLPRPKYWVTDKLYKYLWKTMEAKYGSSTRVKSEKFIKSLAESVALIERRKKYENYVEELDGLIFRMAKLGLIKTRFDFNNFCYDFLPYEFRVKVIPILMPGGKPNIPWDPKTLNDPIIH